MSHGAHYGGCYRNHIDCANEKRMELEERVRKLERERDEWQTEANRREDLRVEATRRAERVEAELVELRQALQEIKENAGSMTDEYALGACERIEHIARAALASRKYARAVGTGSFDAAEEWPDDIDPKYEAFMAERAKEENNGSD